MTFNNDLARKSATLLGEKWKDVKGYEGLYAVSNLGRVWTAKRLRTKGGIMSLSAHGKLTNVKLRTPGVLDYRGLHRLVLEAFVRPCPEGMEGCHWNGNGHDNRLENLRWDTKKANAEDDRRNGVKRRKGGPPLLTHDDVRAIRAEPRGRGVTIMLARCFGVTQVNIQKIRAGICWASVPRYGLYGEAG